MNARVRNIRLDVAYDGTDFHGWQRQPGRPTIQAAIETAIGRLTGERTTLYGAGRTDAGVHAAGQVACFRTLTPIPCSNLARALNALLPRDIRILGVAEVGAGFHPRYAAIAKLYRYRIFQGRVCPPFLARYVYHCPFHLDVALMSRAARRIEGEHDFACFAAADPNLKKTQRSSRRSRSASVRRIFSSRIFWRPQSSILTYQVRGNGFLYHMVRNIVGTLIEVGRGAMAPEGISSILESRDRARAGPTAPAQGLSLIRVEY